MIPMQLPIRWRAPRIDKQPHFWNMAGWMAKVEQLKQNGPSRARQAAPSQKQARLQMNNDQEGGKAAGEREGWSCAVSEQTLVSYDNATESSSVGL